MESRSRALAKLLAWLRTDQVPVPDDDDDANRLVGEAIAQGLAGLLASAVCKSPSAWPEPHRRRLRDQLRTSLATAVRQLDFGRRVMNELLALQIRTLPLKGAALAEALYDSPAQRPMGDIDLLVLDSWPKALDALLERDHRIVATAEHACALRSPEGHVLELHRAVVSCGELFPLDRDELWAASRIGCGQIPRLPGTEDLLLTLALHSAFQHGLAVPLRNHLDLRRLLERLPCDPGTLVARATGSRSRIALAVAVQAAAALVRGRSLTTLADQLGASLPTSTRRWIADVVESSRGPETASSGDLIRARFHVTSGQRLAWIRHTLVPATNADAHPFSRPRRCCRLAWEAARGAWSWALSALGAPGSR